MSGSHLKSVIDKQSVPGWARSLSALTTGREQRSEKHRIFLGIRDMLMCVSVGTCLCTGWSVCVCVRIGMYVYVNMFLWLSVCVSIDVVTLCMCAFMCVCALTCILQCLQYFWLEPTNDHLACLERSVLGMSSGPWSLLSSDLRDT